MTVREGRQWINKLMKGQTPAKMRIGEDATKIDGQSPVKLELKDVWFRYHKEDPDVIRGMSIKIYKGELLTILGGNGTGKSTALSL